MMRNPVSAYVDPERLEQERKILFTQYPQFAGLYWSHFQAALDWVTDFYKKYRVNDVAAFMGGFGFADQHGFIAEKVAMMVLDSSFPDQIKAYRPDLTFVNCTKTAFVSASCSSRSSRRCLRCSTWRSPWWAVSRANSIQRSARSWLTAHARAVRPLKR